jgi:multidrug resistance protein
MDDVRAPAMRRSEDFIVTTNSGAEPPPLPADGGIAGGEEIATLAHAPMLAAPIPDSPFPSSRNASLQRLWVLMATVFVDMIGFAMVLPLLPFYLKRLDTPDWMVGVVISAFAFAQLASAPLWGRLSDRYGRRPMIIAGLLLSAVAYVIFGLAHALWLFFMSRLVQGAGSGTTGVVQAYVSDSIAPEERAKALGWVTAATSAGVMIGPLIGSFAFRFGRSSPGYVAAALCVLNVLSALRWLPESRRRDAASAKSDDENRPSLLSAIVQVAGEPTSPVGSLIWVYAIGMMAFMAMNGVLGLYLRQEFAVTEETIGWFYAYVGGISVVMRALLLGPAVRRLGEVGVMRLGAGCLAVGMLAIPLPALIRPAATVHLLSVLPEVPLRLVALAVIVLLVPVGTALLFPSTTALVSRKASRNEIGTVMGVQQAFGGVSRLLGPMWSTALFGFDVRYPFWLAAGLMLGGGFLTTRMRRSDHQTPVPKPT